MKTGKIVLSIVVLLVFLGFSDALAQWAPNGTHIYNTNPDYVGIGNMAPTTLLHVGKFMGEPTIKIQNPGAGGGATFQMVDQLSGADWKFKSTVTGAFKIRDQASLLDVIYIEKNSLANIMYVDAAGQIAMRHNLPDGHGLNVINYTSGKAAVIGLDQSGSLWAAGMLGVLEPSLMGPPMYVVNAGVLGIKLNAGGNGAAIYGWNNDDNATNYGALLYSDGAATGSGYTNYGVYSQAKFANLNFAGKFVGRVEVDGHANATDAPDYLSHVLVARVNHTVTSDTRAVEGISVPAPGYGFGVYGTGGYRGVYGFGDGTDYTGSTIGVYGYSSGTAGVRYGVYGYAVNPGGTTAIGVYGSASSATNNWAGYFSGDCYMSSDLRIGTTTQAAGYSLSVNGKVACEEVLVEDLASWPDYVFAEDYHLMSLEELEKSIQKNKHLPGLPSAAEVEENGLMLGDMQKRIMEKVEELTLYTIEQGKMISELQEQMKKLEKENARLRKNSK